MSMHIHLEQLPHQEMAVNSVVDAMKDCLEVGRGVVDIGSAYANPTLKRMRNIDVKMETGTGKTYVYTRLMHELYLQYGLNKFIILTPSLPIKEGTKSFIQSESASQHFRELYRNQKISLGVVNAGDFATKKGKRKQFAGAISDYCDATRSDVGTISVLLMNDAMLGSRSMTRDDYDQTLIGGSSCPIEALKLTRPIIIIDEPHRFKKDSSAWKNILSLGPQLIIRFGATFPDVTYGAGRGRIIKKDYDNLVYDLNAVESFNQGLVKAIDINYPNLPEDQAKVQYRVVSATNKELTLVRDGRQFSISVGEDLSLIDTAFEGDAVYEGKRLSNDLELAPGVVLTPGVWRNSYQELILRQAIDAHFEKERDLFYRSANSPRVKVLSLFFIDSIPAYRESSGWLKRSFERLLNEKLESLISSETGEEYKAFLEATRRSLSSDNQKVHAGYFAEDTGKKGDEAIQAEVDDILRGKERLLQFKDEKGEWNTRRFLFSKWTLREGWDNPNVFVLAKLRSSGSENSKIQEVGRGLRLPVDEFGNRISDEEFRLHFLIDYGERDFANKLIGEINSDGGRLDGQKVTSLILEQLINEGYADSRDTAFFKLGVEGVIDREGKVIDREKLERLIPIGLNRGKVRENPSSKPIIKLRKENWEHIRELWNETSKRFMLSYAELSESELGELTEAVISRECFTNSNGQAKVFHTAYNSEAKKLVLTEETVTLDQAYGTVNYGEFVRRLHEATSLPVAILHNAIRDAICVMEPDVIKSTLNDLTIQNITQKFTQKFIEVYSQRYEYDPLDFTTRVSIFDDMSQFVDEIGQGSVGINVATDVRVPANYLYDQAVFDSDIEHEILKQAVPPEVLVFGKLPRSSIKVPTFTGGTSSPDFVYAIRDSKTDNVKVYALIEAKGKELASLSDMEKAALDSQARISKYLDGVELELVNDARKVEDILNTLSKQAASIEPN